MDRERTSMKRGAETGDRQRQSGNGEAMRQGERQGERERE